MQRFSCVVAALVLAASAVPASAQDPVTVDPKHYQVEAENDQVRVLRISYGPHEKSVMHEHPGSVAIFLSGGQVRFTLPDGTVQNVSSAAGATQWNAGGKHLPENVGDSPFEVILVEVKGKPSSAVAATALDAVAVDPKHYKLELENDQVRVLRINYGPKEKSVMHEHPANVAVFLADIQAKFTLPDGTTQDAQMKAGTTMWDAGGKHLPENVGDKPFELILVELKGKPAAEK
jgi:quercetin dioxygenase-like cupin family protein